MKKLLSMIIALSLSIGLSVPALADDVTVELNASDSSVEVGDEVRVRANVDNAEGDITYDWYVDADSSEYEVTGGGDYYDNYIELEFYEEGSYTISVDAEDEDYNHDEDDYITDSDSITISVGDNEYDDEEVISTVRIISPSSGRTVAVNSSVYLDFEVTPDDAYWEEVEWSSSDENILEVDDYGRVTGVSSGTATVTVRVLNIESRWRSASMTFTVGSGTSTSSSTSTASTNTTSGGAQKGDLPTTDLIAKMDEAVLNNSGSAVFQDYTSVSASSLIQAYSRVSTSGNNTILYFDTMNGDMVEGRLTINPLKAASLTADVNLGVFANESATQSVSDLFKKHYSNNLVVAKSAQSGNYGMYVSIAVRTGDLGDVSTIKLYSYNADTNIFQEVQNSNVWLDGNGYIHFDTYLGDYLVLSEGALIS